MSGPRIVIVMGVSGCGKSTVAAALAERIDGIYLDGDDYHPPRNVEKMSGGIALTDRDRAAWLKTLAVELRERSVLPKPLVLACSALKKTYRDRLRVTETVRFLYLKGSFDVIHSRLRSREGHFMQAGLLRSQFETLQEPAGQESDVWIADVTQPVSRIVDSAIDYFDLKGA